MSANGVGSPIGLIGLGTMGSAIAAALQDRGCDLVVHDRRPEATAPAVDRGARSVNRASDVGQACRLVLTSLPGPQEFDDIVCGTGGLLEVTGPGSVLVDLSTNSPAVVQRVGRALAQRGSDLIDAPVSGGAHGARAGTLTVWGGGTPKAFEAARPVLELLGRDVVHVGPLGSGNVVKLVHNLVAAAVNQVLTEGLTLGVRAGVDPLQLWAALSAGALGRARISDRMQHILARELEPGFRLDLAEKDATLARQLATELGVPTLLLDTVYADLRAAVNDGLGGYDAVVVAALQERRSGTSIVVPREELTPAVRDVDDAATVAQYGPR